MANVADAIRHDRLYIDGQWMASTGHEQLEVVSPWSEEIIASVPAGTRRDVDRAVAAARRAFDAGPWPRMPLLERIAVLKNVRDQITDRKEELATLTTDEMGCPITQSISSQIAGALALIGAYLQEVESFPFKWLRTSNTGTALVVREPVGVVAGVVPWNVPLTVSLQKVVPALLAGCTVVLKPAPETPLTAFVLAEMFERAGAPDGVINVVPAGRATSEHLVSHPGTDKVGFTGSTAAGQRIGELCGRAVKRVTLELGGKSAAVILDDADLDQAVQALRTGSLRNSGQICSLKTRIVIPAWRHDEFVERLSAMVRSMPMGDPNDPATEIGPMVTARHRERVNGYIQIGIEEGATVAMGAGEPGLDHGWFVEPTIFTNVRPEMRIAQEEIFGPVLAVLKYEDEQEAVAIANDSRYGLNGSVFTADLSRGLDFASKIRTGTVEINGCPSGFNAPMGGFKQSGIGREAGHEGLAAYTELKSYGIPRDQTESVSAHFDPMYSLAR